MLSPDDVRRILQRPNMTDTDARALLEDLNVWLNRVLDEYFASTGPDGS